MKKQPRQYFNILTEEGSDEATILLYGYIGKQYHYWDEPETDEKDNTDINFVQELNRLAAKYPRIHVRINSPGGEIFHGSAIVTAIRNCTAEVHTWIDGVAASMAGVIWMAGKKRHMAKNGMLMIHSASGLCWGNAADMRETADTLDAFDQSLITSCADALGMSEADMKTKYFDGKDHWLTWKDVDAEKWLSQPDDYKAESKLPEDIAQMSYRDLVALFEENDNPQAPGFLKKVHAFFADAAALFGGNHSQPIINTLDMNLDDFKKSIEEKTLDLEAVKAFLAEQTPPPAAPAPEPAPPVAADPLASEVSALKAQLEDMRNTIAAWGKTPGDGKSNPGMPGGDLPTADGQDTLAARLAKANAQYEAAAENHQPLTVVIGQ